MWKKTDGYGYTALNDQPEFLVDIPEDEHVLFDRDHWTRTVRNRKGANRHRQNTWEQHEAEEETSFLENHPEAESSDTVIDLSGEDFVDFVTSASPTTVFGGVSTTVGQGVATAVGEAASVGIPLFTAFGAAYGIGKAINHIKKHGVTLPRSEYIGPGNPIRVGPARHPSDQVARDHDLAYQEISNKGLTGEEHSKAVWKADKEAINKFWNVYRQTGAFHSLVGAVGLELKHSFEKKIVGRPIYPKPG